jgi:hypothetical protein
MVTIRREAHLAAPAARVWDVASRPATWVDWLSLHQSWPKPPPARLRVGSRLVEKVVLLNIPVVMAWRVTENAVPTSFAMAGKSSIGVDIDIRFDLSAVEGGTDVAITADIDGGLVAGGLKGLALRYADSHLQQSLEKLTILLS